MSNIIKWELSVQVGDGAKTTIMDGMEIAAIDQLKFVVDDTKPFNALVQPAGIGSAKFLFITASTYNDNLIYKVDSSATSNKLNAPVFLTGDGAVSLLGSTQEKFEFTNNITPSTPVTISILVGRDAA
jgi:hypothetical protein